MSSATLVFILCTVLKNDLKARDLFWNVVFTLVFVAVCYVIFSLGFSVNTPRGILF